MTRKIRGGEKEKGSRGATGISLFLLAITFASACGANEGILKSGKETPAPSNIESEKTPIAKDIEAMQTAGFSFIFVLRRKDGGTIDAEDRGVIKLNTADANRRVAADDNKAFIIGSNFQIPPKNLATLYDRFAVENYSQVPAPIAKPEANAKK